MTFEDWWNQQMVAEWWETQSVWPSEYNTAKAAWQAAQEAERRRIYQILDRVAIDANHSQWDACCFTVKDRITGVKNG